MSRDFSVERSWRPGIKLWGREGNGALLTLFDDTFC